MRVTNIDISGLRYDSASARHEGHVSIELHSSERGAPMRVHFLCHSPRERNCPASLVTEDLVSDALRQAHRMPGYRRGEAKLELSQAEVARRTASA
jgi:hypothetical protein